MVLWEITVITAYFLGLKRTYRLALRLQRRLGSNHPKLRHFLHQRTRSVFDVAVNVHKNIQPKKFEAGRNFGNWILRWLDCLKREAPTSSKDITKHVTGSRQSVGAQNANVKPSQDGPDDRVLFHPSDISSKYYSTMSIMRPPRIVGRLNSQCRHMSYSAPNASAAEKRKASLQCLYRTDIAQWMLH